MNLYGCIQACIPMIGKPTAPEEKTGRTRCGARNLRPRAEGRICNSVWQRTGVGKLYVKRPGFGYDRLSNGTPPSPESIGAFRVSNKRADSLTIRNPLIRENPWPRITRPGFCVHLGRRWRFWTQRTVMNIVQI